MLSSGKGGINPSRGFRYMPYIVVIIDNYADLVMGEGGSCI